MTTPFASTYSSPLPLHAALRHHVRCLLLVVFALCMSAVESRAQESRTQYNFLRLPVSAHAAALGGDNISIIEDDASLIYSNPALLSSVSDKTIGLNYMNYMSGANTASATFNRAIKDRASWAVGAQFIDYGKMKETDEWNNVKGEFSAKDIALTGYFSYLLTNRLSGGITAKVVTSYLGDYNSIAIGVDLGLNYYDDERGWSLSAVAKNLGGEVKAYDDSYGRMPIDVQLGVSKTLQGAPFRLSATLVDLTHWNYRFINHLAAGVDVLLSNNIWIGAGYNFRRAEEMKIQSGDDESSHGAGLSLGAGINLERFRINVAYGKYHVSSSSILVNLAYKL
ncbi:MAG: type IX secretion system protein PorQ [Bacteroidaceae bacterium]|nr:type IX secretion system protein PorQ [Bacteroidaceae bacterium]